MTPRHEILHIQVWYVCILYHFKACYFDLLLTSMLNFNCYASPATDTHMLIPGQGAHIHIFLSPPPLNDTVCSIIPKLCTYTNILFIIHLFGCYELEIFVVQKLYWVRTNALWYSTSAYSLQKRSTWDFYHKVIHDCPRKPKMYMQILTVHTYFKVKMVLGASLTSKLQEYKKWLTLSVYYCAFVWLIIVCSSLSFSLPLISGNL